MKPFSLYGFWLWLAVFATCGLYASVGLFLSAP